MRPSVISSVSLGFALVLGAQASADTPQAAAALTVAQSVTVEARGSNLLVSFRGLELASSERSADGMEVTLRFKQPLQDSVATRLSQAATQSIAFATSGYDTLLVRMLQPAAFKVAGEEGAAFLQIEPAEDRLANRRLALAEIRRLSLLGDISTARKKLAVLALASPNDPELLRVEADLDLVDRNTRAAAQKLRLLVNRNPEDQSLRESLAAAEFPHAPRIEAGGNYQKIEGGDTQWREHASARFGLNDTLELRGRLEAVELDDDAVLGADGTLAAFQGTRVRGEVSLVHDFGSLWEGQIRGFASHANVGGGLALNYRNASTTIALSGTYHEPSWEFTESIVAHGTRDVASALVEYAFTDQWQINVQVSLNRYSLQGEEDAAISTSIDAGLQWIFFDDQKTQLIAAYAFDAEYVDDVALRLDGGGNFFALLPLQDRVVHNGHVRWSHRFSDVFSAAIYGGYSKNMMAEGGVIGGLELALEPQPDLRIALNVNYSDVADRSGETGAYTHAGLTVTKFFHNSVTATK